MHNLIRWCFTLLCVVGIAGSAGAQSPTQLSGTAYIDFVHYLDSPDDDLRGHSGFTYRRIYLTADFDLPSDFSARIRLDADESTVTTHGPDVVIKDAYLRWQFHEQHRATMGIMPPPLIEASEDVWGYRGLEEVLVDLSGLAASRDVGFRVSGDLTPGGSLRYGAMIANNSDTRPETNRYKRVYAQLEARSGPWIATIGGNYAGYGDFRRNALMFSGVLGHVSETSRIGIDWYLQQTEFAGGEDQLDAGVSLFGELTLMERWSVVARFDRYAVPVPPVLSRVHTFGIVGIAFHPIDQIRIVPNLYWHQPENAEHDELRLRLTAILDI